MNILTIIVCAYLIFAAVRGLMKGCIGTLVSMVFLIVVLLLTLVLTPFVSKVVAGSTYVRQFYTNAAESFLSGYMTSSGSLDLSSLAGDGSLNDSPFKAAAAVLGLLLSASGAPAPTTEKLVGFLIGLTATAVTFVLVFVALLIARIIIGRSVRKNRIVSGVDRILGLPVGLAKGLIVVWVVLGVINLLAFVPQVYPIAMQIPPSPILSWLNEHNLIVQGMTGLIGRMLA